MFSFCRYLLSCYGKTLCAANWYHGQESCFSPQCRLPLSSTWQPVSPPVRKGRWGRCGSNHFFNGQSTLSSPSISALLIIPAALSAVSHVPQRILPVPFILQPKTNKRGLIPARSAIVLLLSQHIRAPKQGKDAVRLQPGSAPSAEIFGWKKVVSIYNPVNNLSPVFSRLFLPPLRIVVYLLALLLVRNLHAATFLLFLDSSHSHRRPKLMPPTYPQRCHCAGFIALFYISHMWLFQRPWTFSRRWVSEFPLAIFSLILKNQRKQKLHLDPDCF